MIISVVMTDVSTNPVSELVSLLAAPESSRDQAWEHKLLRALPLANVTLLSDGPQTGPDNFPYLVAEVAPNSPEPLTRVMEWLSTRGVGIVINPQKTYPDYILSYGMIWNFRERGEFLSEAAIQPEKTLVIESGAKLLAGAPHPQYLPDYARAILRQFLLDQGILRPKILVVGTDFGGGGADSPNLFDLCFSLESVGSPPEKEHQGILTALSWFLPSHYTIALISEKGLPPFIEL